MYLPKNSIPLLNTKRYPPPAQTSISQERMDMPIDLGSHQRLLQIASSMVAELNGMPASLRWPLWLAHDRQLTELGQGAVQRICVSKLVPLPR